MEARRGRSMPVEATRARRSSFVDGYSGVSFDTLRFAIPRVPYQVAAGSTVENSPERLPPRHVAPGSDSIVPPRNCRVVLQFAPFHQMRPSVLSGFVAIEHVQSRRPSPVHLEGIVRTMLEFA